MRRTSLRCPQAQSARRAAPARGPPRRRCRRSRRTARATSGDASSIAAARPLTSAKPPPRAFATRSGSASASMRPGVLFVDSAARAAGSSRDAIRQTARRLGALAALAREAVQPLAQIGAAPAQALLRQHHGDPRGEQRFAIARGDDHHVRQARAATAGARWPRHAASAGPLHPARRCASAARSLRSTPASAADQARPASRDR